METPKFLPTPAQDFQHDWILINNLSAHTTLGQSHWIRPQAELKPQPISVSVAVPHSLRLAASSDHLPYSVHYGTLCKTIEKLCNTKGKYTCMEHLAEEIAKAAFDNFTGIQAITVRVSKLRALLHAKSVSIIIKRQRGVGDTDKCGDTLTVDDLELGTIVGVNPWERVTKQRVKINLAGEIPHWRPSLDGYDYMQMVENVSNVSMYNRSVGCSKIYHLHAASMSSVHHTKQLNP
jgi:dihydroneopterin aldolase / 2-amino-4-hydroxy-6-hydroxymethyldihydropteridine diphosphokinase / dihydropteroate synthase